MCPSRSDYVLYCEKWRDKNWKRKPKAEENETLILGGGYVSVLREQEQECGDIKTSIPARRCSFMRPKQ